jgi:hypothetical protein
VTRVGAFVGLLVVVFAAALAVGRVFGDGAETAAAPVAATTDAGQAHGGGHGGGGDDGDAAGAPHASTLRLAAARTTLPAAREVEFAFRVLDADGGAVRDFDVAHAKRMHLVVASRDLSEFHHLHPDLDERGFWRTTLRVSRPGGYVAFADFTRDGERTVLRTDLFAPGRVVARPIPREWPRASVDGYDVLAARHEDGMLSFGVTRDGERVRLQPYLGASGHLVVLRAGDLEYLHVHPHGDGLAFENEFPTAGTYRGFLQFRAGDAVRTAAFTFEVEQ